MQTFIFMLLIIPGTLIWPFKKDRKDIKDVREDIKIFTEINSKVIIKFLNFYAL